MVRKLLILVLGASLLTGALSSLAAAGEMPYRIKESQEDRFLKSQGPTSGAVAADALIGRPVGLATTIVGTAVFVVTLPFSAGGGAREASWGLVGRPAGWTFVRPMGRGEIKYEERGVLRD